MMKEMMKEMIKEMIDDKSSIAKWCLGALFILSILIVFTIIYIIFNSPNTIIVIVGIVLSITVLPILVGRFLSWVFTKFKLW